MSPIRFALLAALTLALPAVAVPTVHAQGAAPFMDDPEGDTAYDLFVTGAPLANPQFDNADLRSMQLLEDFDAFTFIIGVKAVETLASGWYHVSWTFKDTEFDLYIYNQVVPNVQNYWGSSLRSYSEDDGWNWISDLEPVVDTTANTITIQVPKAYVLDSRNRMPGSGDKLADMWVEARSYATLFQFSSSVEDRMPDSGEKDFAVNVGDLAMGALRLTADDRVRVSNGGSTTFVFRALLQNRADFDDSVELTLENMPEGWNGTIQSPIKVPAQSERTVTALVSVPFEHDHGGFSSFNLTAVSKRDAASRSAVRMGVLHTPIPQPAGHHSELFLHASNRNTGIIADAFPWTPGSLNTNNDHTADAPEAVADRWGSRTAWSLELDPVLRMGLDFDLERTGEIVGTLIPRMIGEGTLSAKLILYRDERDPNNADTSTNSDDTETLILAESDDFAMTLDLNAEIPFKLTLTPTEDADYVPYRKSQNVALILELRDGQSVTFTNQQGPSLKTADFKATLPLNEYHDRLTGLADAAESLSLKAEGAVEKAGRPGATLTYPFTLRNTEDREIVVNLDVAGGNAEHGTLVPGDQVTLGPRESRALTLAVIIPTTAAANQEFEVLVFAHARDDPTKVAIARTKTTAVTGGAAAERATEDESAVLAAAQAREQKDTPASGALLALAAIGAAMAAASRRRR